MRPAKKIDNFRHKNMKRSFRFFSFFSFIEKWNSKNRFKLERLPKVAPSPPLETHGSKLSWFLFLRAQKHKMDSNPKYI